MTLDEAGPLPQLLVGGYTAEQGGQAPGLTLLAPAGDGRGAELAVLSTLDLVSPSYLVRHPREPWVFAVSETDASRVSSVARSDDGRLVLLSDVATGGSDACHLALSPDGTRLLVAHYGSGSVASFLVGADGRLSSLVDRVASTGTGPDPDRQAAPHAHQVVWDGEEVLVPDLGTDRLHRLHVGADGALTGAGPAVVLPAGSGPRHLVVLGDHLAVACELSGQLWLAARTDDGWLEVASVPCSAAAEGASVQPSALRADGDQLYVANRGPATVAVFTLDRPTGLLTPVAEFGCGGAGPRDLVLEPARLWVVNQADDRVSVFDRRSVPPLAAPGQLPSASPACVVLDPFAQALT